MASTVFAGSKVKTLKDTLSLNGGADVISSSTDPTSVAVNAPIGSLLINSTSGKLYRKLDSGSSVNWEEVGSGVGGINYILNPNAEVNTTGWNTYADAAGSAPVDGTGGTPNISWNRVASASALRGVAEFQLVKDAANRQGQGVSYDFTIDEADKAKPLTVSFDYKLVSGTYADGALTVYLIADPTGTPVVIQPAGYTVQAGTVGTMMTEIATFQTQATGTSYRLCFHIASTAATAFTLAIDNVVVGPQSVVYGSPITDWQDYTPDVFGFGAGTNVTTQYYRFRRIGDSIQIMGLVTAGGTSISASGNFEFTIPSGLTFDFNKALVGQTIGSCEAHNTGSFRYGGIALIASSNSFKFSIKHSASSGGNLIGATEPDTGWWNAAGDEFSFILTAPISGWSSSVQMSNDTDTRVVAFIGSVITTSIPTGTYDIPKIIAPVLQIDTHGAYNQASGFYTIPVSGFYEIEHENVMLVEAGKAFRVGFTINSTTSYARAFNVDNASTTVTYGLTPAVKATVYLNAGDLIRFAVSHTNTASTNLTNDGRFQVYSIKRVSGPATIAASETVAFSARSSNALVVVKGTVTTILTWNIVEKNTHNCFSSGVFTAPVSGSYAVSAGIGFPSSAWDLGSEAAVLATQAGSVASQVRLGSVMVQAANTFPTSVSGGTHVFNMKAGDTLTIQVYQTSGLAGSSKFLTTDSTFNRVSVVRVGN